MHLDDGVLIAGRIDPAVWAQRLAEEIAVGECDDRCHALVFATGTSTDGYGRQFFEMACGAGHEATVPAGSVVRSARTMPLYGAAWYDDREPAVA